MGTAVPGEPKAPASLYFNQNRFYIIIMDYLMHNYWNFYPPPPPPQYIAKFYFQLEMGTN